MSAQYRMTLINCQLKMLPRLRSKTGEKHQVRVATGKYAGQTPQADSLSQNALSLGRERHEVPLSCGGNRRRCRRRIDHLSSCKNGLVGHLSDRALGPDGRVELACRRRRTRPERRSEHFRPSGVHHRPAWQDRRGKRAVRRHAHDRRPDSCRNTGPLGMAAVGLPGLPEHRNRGRTARDARGSRRHVSGPLDRRHPWRAVGGPRRLRGYHGNGACLRRRGEEERCDGDRAQPCAGTEPDSGGLGRRHGKGHDFLRTCRQRGRPVGEAGRQDGGDRAARVAAVASLSAHRDDPGGGRARSRVASRRRSRGLHLYAPGPAGHAARHL